MAKNDNKRREEWEDQQEIEKIKQMEQEGLTESSLSEDQGKDTEGQGKDTISFADPITPPEVVTDTALARERATRDNLIRGADGPTVKESEVANLPIFQGPGNGGKESFRVEIVHRKGKGAFPGPGVVVNCLDEPEAINTYFRNHGLSKETRNYRTRVAKVVKDSE